MTLQIANYFLNSTTFHIDSLFLERWNTFRCLHSLDKTNNTPVNNTGSTQYSINECQKDNSCNNKMVKILLNIYFVSFVLTSLKNIISGPTMGLL